jgi:hypothetical protein
MQALKINLSIILVLFFSCSSFQSKNNSLSEKNLRKFKIDKPIVLLETNFNELIDLYGEPIITITVSENNVAYQNSTWVFNNVQEHVMNKNIKASQRELHVRTKDSIVVEYLFCSSFEEDATNYNTDEYKLITKSMPIKKVIEILGDPNGIAQVRIDKENNPLNLQGNWSYKLIYNSPTGSKVKNINNQQQYTFSSKRLEIIYDTENTVKAYYSIDIN